MPEFVEQLGRLIALKHTSSAVEDLVLQFLPRQRLLPAAFGVGYRGMLQNVSRRQHDAHPVVWRERLMTGHHLVRRGTMDLCDRGAHLRSLNKVVRELG